MLGTDSRAYVIQAGQFISGQTDYDRLVSKQGPCNYPAGHLWHYALFYKLYLLTDHGQLIFQAAHYLVYCAVVALWTKIAFAYYRRQPEKAQLAGFMLATNWRYLHLQSEVFNDTFLELYLALAFYFLVLKNKPLQASVSFALGLSVKTGGLLAAPAFLGIVQLQNGTGKLLLCMAILAGIQMMVAAPFVHDRTARLLGFQGAHTSFETYQARFLGQRGDSEMVEHGADWGSTIFWRFLSEERYASPDLPWWTKRAQVAANVYYFFVRRNCLPACLLNLWYTFATAPRPVSNAMRRKHIELFCIMLLAGGALVPGGHQQF